MTNKVTKSDKIRELFDAGMQVADIARLLGIRYQFAYNVVSWHVQQAKREVAASDTRDRGDGRVRHDFGSPLPHTRVSGR